MSTDSQTEAQANEAQFMIQRIYTKDLSFEAPNTPDVFQQDWEPDVNLNMQTQAKALTDTDYEVVLTATVTVKSKDNVAFLVEVQQAGIFTIANIEQEQAEYIQGAICPGILYPYVREVISDVVTRGSFPQLCLAPMDFESLYAQQLEQQKQQANSETVH